MAFTMRIWLDELDRLDDYSHSFPTGQCRWKTWKRRKFPDMLEWAICQYGESRNGYIKIHYFNVVLLQGPRRANEPMRFKTECTPEEVRSWRT
jgi:hypothetical protein